MMQGRWRGWVVRTDDTVRREVDDELQAHLDARIAHLVARGMTPEAARVEAIRRFGDLDTARAALQAAAVSRWHRRQMLDTLHGLVRDARYAARALAQSPAFTGGVMATLGLGLGINSAVFRVADRALLRPPAGVREPDRLRRVDLVPAQTTVPGRAETFSYPDATAILGGGAFESAALVSPARLLSAPEGRNVAVAWTDDRFFPLLGVHPLAGRAFDASETRPGAGIPVAIASFDYWSRHLAGAPADGSVSMTIGGRTYRLVGVLPRGFTGVDLDPVDVWMPLGIADFGRGVVNGVDIPWFEADMLRALRIFGRPDRTIADAVVGEHLTALLAHKDTDAGIGRAPRTVAARPIVPPADGGSATGADLLLARLAAVAALVLLIACANSVNLLLARSLRRRREIAIRLAIGASRARIFRLLIVESALVGLLGGGVAALAGAWTADALRRLVFPDARWASSFVDRRTLLFTIALAAASGIAAGVVPAVQATRAGLLSALREGRGGGGGALGATRAAMIVVQTAVSLVLLVASGLLVLSLVRLNAVDLGFSPDGLVMASVDAFAQPSLATAEQVAERLANGRPGDSVALASVAPFGATSMRDFTVPGSTFEPSSWREQPQSMAVSATFFNVLETRVVRGRGFTPADTRGAAPVAIVNESMASRYWGPAVPSGACIVIRPGPCALVVGVVQDVRESPAGAAPMRFYQPLAQFARGAQAVLVRTRAEETAAVAAAIRAAVPATQRVTIEIVADRVSRATRPWRTSTWLFLALGAVALVLASIGIYSVMSYLAAERQHELGVRIALGATPRDLLQLLLGGGLRPILIGAAGGLLASVAAARAIRTLLYAVSPFDPAIYALGFAGLLGAGVVAMLAPALRASRVNPVIALRSE